MQDMRQFIDLELTPFAGDFADDFDLEAIADEVTEYDPVRGIVWRQDIEEEEELGRYDTLTEIFKRHDLTAGARS